MPINSFLYPGAKVTPAYEVANSCRFNDGDSAFITRANAGSDGTTDTWTMSMWVKRGVLGTTQFLFHGYTSGNFNVSLRFTSDDQLYFFQEDHPAQNGRLLMTTARKFRDPSAWYHIVAQYDSTQSTNTNRAKIYINGVQETTFNGSVTWPDQNFDSEMTSASTNIHIGKENGGDYFDGYMAEVVLLDGTAASPTSFGEYDEDSPTIFKPKDVSGLTFGTHGFYLDFEDSSNLGNDVNGGTDFTENNLAATDQATDTPTNNFATLNPIDDTLGYYTFSEGNCQVVSDSSGKAYTSSTLAVSKGKWYFETKMSSMVADERFLIGIAPRGAVENDHPDSTANGGINLSGFNAVIYSQGSSVLNNFFGNNTTRFDSWTGIIGMALDLTDGSEQITFSKDGAWVTGSGTTSTTFASALQVDISAKMDESTATGFWHLVVGEGNGSAAGTFQVNFGGCPAFTVSSGNADGNGYGNFEYPVPSGYLALCTKNVATDS